MQNTIHFILQGKGGIGKSFTAYLLAQYLKSKAGNLRAFDTDQVNTTLANYKALNVEAINVVDGNNEIDIKGFDILVEKLLTEEGPFVIDNGANSFMPILSYMAEGDIFSLLRDSGKRVYVHTIVGGGDTMADTANGFNSIAKGIGDTPIVLWLNEHFGPMKTVDGKEFTETKLFKTHEDRLRGTVILPARNPKTYGKDMNTVNAKRLTFDEVKGSKEFMTVEKQRIHIVAKDTFDQLEKIEF